MLDLWDAWRAAFIEHRRLSLPRSIRNVHYELGYFLSWCRDRGIYDPFVVDSSTIESYQRWCFFHRKPDGKLLSTSSQIQRLIQVRNFYRWLLEIGRITQNPAEGIRLPKQGVRLPKDVLTLQEVVRLLDSVPLDRLFGLRDRAIMETFFSTGIRCNELSFLRLDDLRIQQLELFVSEGKGGHQRVLPIGQRALDWICRYLEDLRPSLVRGLDPGWLFLSLRGNKINYDTLSHLIHKYMVDVNLGHKGSCHALRHTMATLMLEGGADIRYIQEMLGHTSLQSTQIYTRVSILKLKEVYSKTHPAEKDEDLRHYPGHLDDSSL